MDRYDTILAIGGVLIALMIVTITFTELHRATYMIAACLIAITGVALFRASPGYC
jgi:formate-dependent nitrite reductase membrane component NrfD